MAHFLNEPHLSAPMQPCLRTLEAHLLLQSKNIEAWFCEEWKKTPAPVYGSIDLRNAGFKLAPIDMNLFPAGFNNLNPNFLSYAIAAAKKNILQQMPTVKRILVLPENHTRNLFYWENIKTLRNILENAGFEVRLGSLLIDIHAPQEITLLSGEKIIVEPLLRQE